MATHRVFIYVKVPDGTPSAGSAHQGARSFRLCEHFALMTPSHDPATGSCLAALATEVRVGHLHDATAIGHGISSAAERPILSRTPGSGSSEAKAARTLAERCWETLGTAVVEKVAHAVSPNKKGAGLAHAIKS
jgi:hypothetical protein